VDACLVIRVLRAPSGSSLGSLDGGGGRACEVGGGNHKDPLGLGDWSNGFEVSRATRLPPLSRSSTSPPRRPGEKLDPLWFLPRLFGRGRVPSLRGAGGRPISNPLAFVLRDSYYVLRSALSRYRDTEPAAVLPDATAAVIPPPPIQAPARNRLGTGVDDLARFIMFVTVCSRP
jgi:hypothetical protein